MADVRIAIEHSFGRVLQLCPQLRLWCKQHVLASPVAHFGPLHVDDSSPLSSSSPTLSHFTIAESHSASKDPSPELGAAIDDAVPVPRLSIQFPFLLSAWTL
jgi:hypothetical protein